MKRTGLVLVFMAFLLSACGRTGALYLPSQQKSSSAQQKSTQGQQDFMSMHPAPNTE